MKKFINLKINSNYKLLIILLSLTISFTTLLLIFFNKFVFINLISILLIPLILIALYINLKYVFKSSKDISLLYKISLTSLAVAICEIFLVITGRELFAIYLLFIPLLLHYFKFNISAFAVILVAAMELKLNTGYYPFLNILFLGCSVFIYLNLFNSNHNKSISERANLVPEDEIHDTNPDYRDHLIWEHSRSLIRKSLEQLTFISDYNSIIFFIKNESGDYEISEFLSNLNNEINNTAKIKQSSSYIDWVIKRKTAFITGDVKNIEVNIPYYRFKKDIKSFLAVPVFNELLNENSSVQDVPVGLVVVDSLKREAFDELIKSSVSVVASRISLIISNYHYQKMYQEKSSKLDSLYLYINKLESNIDVDQVYKNLISTLKNIFENDLISISLRKGNSSTISFLSDKKVSLKDNSFYHSNTLVGSVSDNNKSFNLKDVYGQSKKRILYSKEIDRSLNLNNFKNILICPISASENKDDEIFGAVLVARKDKEINQEQRQLTKTLVQQAAKTLISSKNLDSIKEQAVIDSLSGLYNQRYFKEMLSRAISRAIRYPEKISLILFDIDNFKQINDQYGHIAGDNIITEIGRTIIESIREVDIPARYGGDEFAIILPKTNNIGSMVLAEKIKTNFENKTWESKMDNLICTFSMGIATFPDNAETKDQLFEKADTALYEAKKSGKNTIVHFDQMDEKRISEVTS